MRRFGLTRGELIGLSVLVGGTLLWVLAFTNGLSGIFGGSSTTVKADFASVEDIVTNDPVRIHGVQVGSVGSVTGDPGGRGGTVTMNIDTSDPIYRDASANILWRTVLGANDAIAIDPGTRSAGLLGDATLPQSQNSNQVELDQITQAIHGGAQSGIQTTLAQLGTGLSQHPALGQDLNTLARIAPTATVGIGALRGEIQDTDLRNLVANAGRAAQAVTVGTGGSETRQFVQSAAATMADLSVNQATLQNDIAILAPDLAPPTYVFPRLDPLTYRLAPLLTKLNGEVGQVAPTLRALRPALTHADTLLHSATPLLNALRPTVRSLATTAGVGSPVIDQLKPGLDNLMNVVLPGLAQKGAEEGGRTAYEEIGPFATGFTALIGFFDQDGHFANLTAGLGEANAQQVLPCSLDFSQKDLVVCNTLSAALQQFFTGGTSLLQGLIAKPGGQALTGALTGAERVQSRLQQAEQSLRKQYPLTARYLLQPNHGGLK